MSDPQWYVNSAGKLFGPLTTAELEQLFRENTVRPSDLIAMAGDEKWLSAPEVFEMFRAAREANADDSPSHAAADILAKIAKPKLATSDEAEEVLPLAEAGGLVSNLLSRGSQGVAGVCSALSSSISGLIGAVIEAVVHTVVFVFNLRRSKFTLAALAVFLAAILLRNARFSDSDYRPVMDQFAALAEEIDALRHSQNATAADWVYFRRSSLETLDPTIKRLSETASRDHPLMQTFPVPYVHSSDKLVRGQLLECGYALRTLLRNQGGPDDVRYAFTKNMNAVREKLSVNSSPIAQ